MSSAQNPNFKIILGSSSRFRRQILSEMGYEFIILSADIDEKGIRREEPEELVMALAEAKAAAIISKLLDSGSMEEDEEPTLLITADQNLSLGKTKLISLSFDATQKVELQERESFSMLMMLDARRRSALDKIIGVDYAAKDVDFHVHDILFIGENAALFELEMELKKSLTRPQS